MQVTPSSVVAESASAPTSPSAARLWLGRAAAAGLLAHAAFLPISMAGMQIGLGVMLGALLVLRFTGQRVWARSRLDLPLLLFVGATLASIVIAWIGGMGPVGWHEVTISRSVLSPILILSGLEALAAERTGVGEPRRLALAALVVWGCAALLPSGMAWVQHYTGFDPMFSLGLRKVAIRPPAPHDPGHYAAAGFFHWYQRLAHNLTPPLCLAMGITAYGAVSRRLRAFLALVCVAVALCVVLTTSRLAWGALAGAAFLLAVLGGWRVMRWALPAVVVAALGTAMLLPGARDRLLNATALKDNGDRVTIWRVCSAMVKDHPIIGVGSGNLPQRSRPYYARLAPEVVPRGWCHDSFFTAWAEGGPLLFCAMIFYWSWLVRAFWIARREGDPLGAAAGALAGIFAMFANALGHDILYSSETMFGFGFMLGIAAVLARGKLGAERAEIRSR